MIRLWRSFHARLSLLFLTLLLGVGVVGIVFSLHTARSFLAETEQKLNRPLAARMADEFQPHVRERIDDAMIEDRIRYLTGLNPRIDIYLLGSDGMIKAGYTANGDSVGPLVVPTAPLEAFVAGAPAPLLALDPMHPEALTPFVAAPIEIMGEQGCFVYVVLSSGRYQSMAAMVQGSYIARAALGGLALVVVVTALVGTGLFAVLTRRLRAMARTVQSFAAGRLDRRAETTGTDEIAVLARSFNHMADTIVAGMEDLQRTDRQRRELIANISHDLRSPLASVAGYLETALLKLPTDGSCEEVEAYLRVAVRNADALGRLVEQLFELSRLEARQVEPRPEAFSLDDLVQDVAMQFEPRAREKGVALDVELAEATPLVWADIGLVERAIRNLVDNAITYTPAGGRVRIVPGRDAGRVRLDVVDTGVGIPDDELPHVFERFYRVEKSRNAHTGGSGLGLAIARTIAELHGGTIDVESAVGHGTTFSLVLPARAPALQPA